MSYFRKEIDNPIEYVEAAQGFTFTRPVNYPKGKLIGWEAEIRQELKELEEELHRHHRMRMKTATPAPHGPGEPHHDTGPPYPGCNESQATTPED